MERRTGVACIIKNMNVGDKETFPIAQYNTVASTVSRINTLNYAAGERWATRFKRGDEVVTVTRCS